MENRLENIYDKTDGNCHICFKKLSYLNYGILRSKGAWEIEHSIARANGGSDHLNNLFPACITCNRGKGTKHTKTARSQYGNTRAPYSRATKRRKKNENTFVGRVAGGIIGSIFGPAGFFIGAAIGSAIGNETSPKK